MKNHRVLPLLLAFCLLFSSCARVAETPPESSSQPLPESVSSEEIREKDLVSEVKEAMLGADTASYVAAHGNVVVEEEAQTLGIERVESFYRSFLNDTPAELYIGRHSGAEIVVYHLNFTGGNSYTLAAATGTETTEHTLSEINRTENEYIFSTDTTMFQQAAEVGRNGSNGLTVNNLCTHTWQHSFPEELVKLAGSAEFEAWKEEGQSRTRCNVNLFQFLRDFKISYSSFMDAYGNKLADAANLNEIITEVYPENLPKPKEIEPELPATPAVRPPEATGTNFIDSVEQEIIDEINAEREALGMGLLEYDKNLHSAARIRSRELCESGVWAHTRPNGDPWQTVLRDDVPTQYAAAGENLANVEYNDPRVSFHTDAHWWFEEWKSSEGHYENMVREEFTHVGVGLYYVKDENGMITAYATTIFARYE